MKALLTIFLLTFLCTAPGSVKAHDMTLDENGCHRDGIYGKYHCHEGEHANETFVRKRDYPAQANRTTNSPQDSLVKMSSEGVCFPADDALAKRLKRYWVYQSIEECLGAGGHLDGAVFVSQQSG